MLTNLDALVMIYKNWPNDVEVRCHLANIYIGGFFNLEIDLFDAHEDELGKFDYFGENV